MRHYRHAAWKRFRLEIIKLHDSRCARCNRSQADGIILQAHHKFYVPGRMPWQYDYAECIALCKGCHAEEHGHIMPKSGWQFIGVDDLGTVADECDWCSKGIRYVYAITHEDWGAMAVGTDCCDTLTSSTQASEHHDRYTRAIDVRKRFVASTRWKLLPNGDLHIREKHIGIAVRPMSKKFVIVAEGAVGKAMFETVLDAKLRVFDFIHSGEAADWLRRRKLHEARKMEADLTRWHHPRRLAQYRTSDSDGSFGS